LKYLPINGAKDKTQTQTQHRENSQEFPIAVCGTLISSMPVQQQHNDPSSFALPFPYIRSTPPFSYPH